MIKQLNSLSKREIEDILGKNVVVEEKIDAPYYTATIDNGNVIVKKSNGSQIGIVDWTLNDMNKTVVTYCNNIAKAINDRNRYTIGLFYFPSDTPRSTTYRGMAGKFMVSHMEIENKDTGTVEKIESPEKFLESFGISIEPKPIVLSYAMEESDVDKLRKYKDGIYGNMMFCQKLLGSKISASKLKSAEGYIFRFPSFIYKVELNKRGELADAIERKMSRDIVLKDFVNWFTSNKIEIIQGRTYISAVTNLFSSYIKTTDVTYKYDLRPEDLTPPCIGYSGDLCYDFITDEDTIKLLKSDETSKCIYKILLSALNTGIRKKPDDILTDKIVSDFNNISKKIKAETY